MGRFVWSQLRHRFGRTAALLLGIVVATTSFTVLTATSRTSQLRTTATVGEHFRVAYDVLVRPQGAQSAVEATTGTVQPNFLSGIYGGISTDQWHNIQEIPGVDVAAPIAMVGTGLPSTYLTVPVTRYLTGSPRQLFRIKTTWVSERGLTRVPQPDSFVYVTDDDLQQFPEPQDDNASSYEVLPDGAKVRTCGHESDQGGAADPFGPANRSELACYFRQGGQEETALGLSAKNPGYLLRYQVPLLVAGVDPVSEAKLAHLDEAVVAGRYLRPDDAAKLPGVPVLVNKDSGVDNTAEVTIERMADPAAPLPVIPVADLPAALSGPGTSVGETVFTAQSSYDKLLNQIAGLSNTDLFQALDGYWQSGPSDYTGGTSGALLPEQRSNPPSTWQSTLQHSGASRPPMDNADSGFRTLAPHTYDLQTTGATLRSVGVYDPAKLPAFDPLSDVDLGLYSPVSATAADAASRSALAGKDLLPNGNLAGHLRQPPQLITTLDGIAPFYGNSYSGPKPTADPISVIRVRVGGVVGPDAVSRERVNQVAQQIAVQTGLQVDLVVGPRPLRPLYDCRRAGSGGRSCCCPRAGSRRTSPSRSCRR